MLILRPAIIPLLVASMLIVAAVSTYSIVNSQSANSKYDTDGDGLIEIEYLEQLNAIRYDLDGNGGPDKDSGAEAYSAAFPTSAEEQVCKGNCNGYELARSLDFDNPDSYVSGSVNTAWTMGSGWLPIGDSQDWFDTSFDGNGSTISNLYINRTSPLVGERYIGLFGLSETSSIIREIGLINVNVTGVEYVGGLAGRNRGTISASYTTGKCAGQNFVGGLVGGNIWSGLITNSYSTATVSGSWLVGGLVGFNSKAISASYSIGNVSGNREVGGLVGGNQSAGSIITSFAIGRVSGGSDLGGLIGTAGDGSTIVASYWDTRSTGQRSGVGEGDSTGAEGKTTSDMRSPSDYTGIYSGWKIDLDNADRDFDPTTGVDDYWDFGTSRQYPVLKVDTNEDGTATWWEFGPQVGSRSTPTPTPTPRPTSTPKPTNTPTLTPTATHTPTPIPTNTPTPTPPPTNTPTPLPTDTPTPTPLPTDTPTPTPIPTDTPTPVPINTPTATPTPTPTAEPTQGPIPTYTRTPIPTATPVPATDAPAPTVTPEPTATPALTPEVTLASSPAESGGGACGLPARPVSMGAAVANLFLLAAPLGMIWGLKWRGRRKREG